MTSSILKIIAMVTMLIDHTGMLLFPDVAILRIIGRIAFPIFAYCITEGCIHTRNLKKYMLRLCVCGAIFQLIQWLVLKTWTPCVILGYVAAVGFVMVHKWAKQKWNARNVIPSAYILFVSLALFITQTDYLCFGFLFIIFAYLMHNHWIKWILMGAMLLCASCFYEYQLWSFMALPILMLYNGKTDNLKMGKVMYYFYPLHFLVLGVIQYVVNLR